MQALKYKAEVGTEGEVILPRLSLNKGTPIEVIVLVREPTLENDTLLKASESTLGFWNNSIDDEVWNNA